jgi:hypothetical protein
MIDFDLVRGIALRLPDVQASDSARGPALKVRGRLMACPAIHKSAEPNTLMVRVSMEERDQRIATNSDVYYVTDHYRKYPALLVRMSKIERDSLEDLLTCSWRFLFE